MPTAQLQEIPINSDLHRVDLNENGNRVNLILPRESIYAEASQNI